jgi:hypothetical protein
MRLRSTGGGPADAAALHFAEVHEVLELNAGAVAVVDDIRERGEQGFVPRRGRMGVEGDFGGSTDARERGAEIVSHVVERVAHRLMSVAFLRTIRLKKSPSVLISAMGLTMASTPRHRRRSERSSPSRRRPV